MRSSGAITVVFSIGDMWFIVETLFPVFFTSFDQNCFWNDCSVPFVSWLLLLKKIRFHHELFSSVQSLSCVQLFETPWTAARHASLAQICVAWVGDAIQRSHPLSSPSAIFKLSQHWGLFQWVSSSHQGGQSIGASASVLPVSIQYWSPLGWTGWISLQSWGLFKSLLQHHSSKASILQHSTFFMVQLSYPWASLVAQLVKTPPVMRFDPWVRTTTWRRDRLHTAVFLAFPDGSDGKESACNAGDLGSIPGLERSPGEGHGNPLQYSSLKNTHGQRSLVSYSLWGHKQSDTKGN